MKVLSLAPPSQPLGSLLLLTRGALSTHPMVGHPCPEGAGLRPTTLLSYKGPLFLVPTQGPAVATVEKPED